MDKTVSEFFTKNAGDDYAASYRLDHSPRIQAMIDRYDLRNSLKGKRLVDVGGGLGFAGELLDPSTDYWVIDGADVSDEMKVAKGTWCKADLNRDGFGGGKLMEAYPNGPSKNGAVGYKVHDNMQESFYAAFCLETLEHLSDPYHCLVEIKKLVKPDGEIYLSIPDETVWHNTIYCGLLWPVQNFAQFLGQMALPIVDFYVYKPSGRGWPAYQFKCRNAAWSEKVMMFKKTEEKFKNATPVEMTNL